ncbi:hypothetical protein [Kineococcus sp. R86509]|uniref:hypothetical protein n=1 Tax=Kineococcus sp. R86509 TaxID=3093851 RepID=UPI0036D2F43C
MFVRRVTTVLLTLLPHLATAARWTLRQVQHAGRGLQNLYSHPHTRRGVRLALLLALMLANAAATFTVNQQTWAAVVLAATNAANTLLLIVGILDWHRSKK